MKNASKRIEQLAGDVSALSKAEHDKELKKVNAIMALVCPECGAELVHHEGDNDPGSGLPLHVCPKDEKMFASGAKRSIPVYAIADDLLLCGERKKSQT
jgi:hypothetical protein